MIPDTPDPEVMRLAEEVAAATGETTTEAIETALQERWARVEKPQAEPVEEAERQRRREVTLTPALSLTPASS